MIRCPRCFLRLQPDKPCPDCRCCRNCGSKRAPFRRGRCNPCRMHLARTGEERPLELVEAHVYRKINRELESELHACNS